MLDQEYYENYSESLLQPKCGENSSDEDKKMEESFKIKCEKIYKGVLKEVNQLNF